MRRRRFFAGIAAATLCPDPVAAQNRVAKPLVAFLSGVSEERNRRLTRARIEYKGAQAFSAAVDSDHVAHVCNSSNCTGISALESVWYLAADSTRL